jgi:WD40 repeat protein/predicted Ser/Thr protein kinase
MPEIRAVHDGEHASDSPIMSSAPRVCRKCGAEIFADAPEGLCTACLFETGLNLLTDDPVAGLEEPGADAARPLPRVKQKSDRAQTFANFGDYELLEVIGRGGQGVVYRARQKNLNRTVALKVIGLGQWATEAHLKRFRLEAEAAASLEHPGIVPIYEVGERDGSCYFSMKFVEGGQLDEVVRREPMPLRRAVELIGKVARTVQYAHQRGVLHRDIKPGNILLDRHGEPHLTDFGLARLVEKESTVTRTMQLLGTPSYMAPEQAAGRNQQLTTAADVYGLGAVFYQLLTGTAPFAGGTTYETIKLVLESSPRRPSLLNPAVPRDLEVICLKCLEKDPGKRYSSAKALADDLERFLRDEPIVSRPVSRGERLWRWCKRKPVVAGLTAALILTMITGFGAVLWELRRVQQQELIARRNLYCADMNLAYQAWQDGNLPRAQLLLRAHLPERGREGPSRAGDLRGFEWRYLWQLCRDESLFTFTNIQLGRDHVNPSERQALVPAANDHIFVTASGNTLKWRDMATRREVQTVDVGGEIVAPLAAAMNRPGLIAYYTDKIHCISPTGEQLLGGGVVHESCNALALSPDGLLLASGGLSRYENVPVRLWDVRTGAQIAEHAVSGKPEGVTHIVFSPDGKYLVCATSDLRIQVLELPTLHLVKTLEAHTAFMNSLAFDSTGTRLASASNDSRIVLWDFASGRQLTQLTGHRGSISDVAFAPDGQTLVSAGRDQTVRVWDLRSPGRHAILRGHRGGVRSVVCSTDGKELYSLSDDGTLKIWQMPSAGSGSILQHDTGPTFLTFSPDGKLLAVVPYDRRGAVIWDVASRRRSDRTIGEHAKLLQRVAFSPDGRFLATAGLDDEVQVWDVSENKKSFEFPKGRGPFFMRFHPRKPILAIAADAIRFWDLRTGQETGVLVKPATHGVQRVVFSPDEKWIALGMSDGRVSIWNLATGLELCSFHEHRTIWAAQLCFSHDSRLLASGGDDHRIVLYDVLRRRVLKSFTAHTDLIWGLAFASDDKTLVSSSWDGTIKFWSMANQQLALTLAPGGTLGLALSPDGKLLATSGFDGTVRLWPAPSLAEIDAEEKRAQK